MLNDTTEVITHSIEKSPLPQGSFTEAQLHEVIPNLKRFARARTRNEADADDLLQETITRALEKKNQWQQGTDFKAWMFTVMNSLFINNVRRTERFKKISSAISIWHCRVALPAQENHIIFKETITALTKLPTVQSDILFIAGTTDLSSEQIAEHLNIATGTVRTRLYRGRKHARMLLGEPIFRER